MSESDAEEKILITSNDTINCNYFSNKTKPNIKNFYYEEYLNNCVNCLTQLSQVTCTRSYFNNRIYTKCTCLKSLSRVMGEGNYIMKYAAEFMISWFGMTIIEWEIVLHQCIMYAGALEVNFTTQCLLPGKQSTSVGSEKVQERLFICKTY